MDRNAIMKLLASHRTELKKFDVRSLSLFGSVAREEARPDSDVDILVDFEKPVGLLTFIGLQQYLEDLLGRSVDLVASDALREEYRERILREAVFASEDIAVPSAPAG
ncbi:MAG: nucleotidyltransferase [Dehalococcoidia bacterium]|nr:nucleotidyltransferase [Dehalococcoidia bacterium]